ncbi:MAG: hypothetical protein SVR08_03510 [Spirochaetota bacterium]|nr:hypothetical protein [Spirochaetota bacterium]
MNERNIDRLYNIADEFGSIAKKVNESSVKRKEHSDNTIDLINKSYEIGKLLNKDIKKVSKANAALRSQDNIVLNTSYILTSNIKKQREILQKLEKNKSLNHEVIDQMMEKINGLSDSLNEAISNIQNIIKIDNEIIMMDNLLIMQKQFQQEAIKKLSKLASKSLEDAKKAIKGSSSNLDRGQKMAKRFKSVKQLIKKGDVGELERYIDEAITGWNIAVDVNKSSKSQFEFSEKVNEFTKRLHNESMSIRDLVAEKHSVFENNLQTITVLTVIVFLKFKKYLEIEKIVETIENNSKDYDLIHDLITFIKVACKDVKSVITLNYDMTESIKLNNEVETRAFDLSKDEMKFYDEIKNEVQKMTEATRYPVDGSGKNIKNGQILERQLREIVEEMQV